MPREKIWSVQDSPFSSWHRSQHDGIAMTDIDVCGICPACAEPLFIADTIYNRNFTFKSKSKWLQRPYTVLASNSNIPYFEIFYTVDESTKNREIIRFDIRRIHPHSDKEWTNLAPDHMLQMLEHFAVKKHGPDCSNKEFLIKKIQENKCGNLFVRQQNYVKFLSI